MACTSGSTRASGSPEVSGSQRRRRTRLAIGPALSAALLAGIILSALAAPLLAPYGLDDIDLAHRLQPPGGRFLLGSDALGRDVLTRLLFGGRVSLLVGSVAVVLSGILGSSLGLVCGYLGGWFDALIMRLVDVWQAVPYLVLALAFAVVLGPGIETLVLVLALGTWTTFARLVRAETLAVRERESVLAARVIGASQTRILLRHVLPQVGGTLAVTLSLMVASTILFEASLSFLGLGVQRPTPSWGNMLLDGVDVLGLAWWVSFFPGLAVLLASLAINTLGDWLRDALDPLR
jgi:peptide/nickel transport system permease protein